ncbi:MAG: L-seryl-tRNA(Sec) selenium transferase [Firmicutes bacterium]|nr:L-seryl-tRNA(Sec) selenium transferase [Bacillota bacterium]
MDTKNQLLRMLPSVDSCLAHPQMQVLLGMYSRHQVVKSIRVAIQEIRGGLLQGDDNTLPSEDALRALVLEQAYHRLGATQHFELQSVINATGIILHTNLGRAVLPEAAIEAITAVASGYSNLELDLTTGERGDRQASVKGLVEELTGAEAALVVNNNAAAVFLCLNTLAQGKEVIVSRGEQVEIGGSFRIPDVVRASGAHLVEVGTTNRTHIRDYAAAIHQETAAILKVHTSNYKIIGFTAAPSRGELVQIGNAHRILVMEDLGGGNLLDLSSFGLSPEPTVKDSIAAGVDLVTFSGDKLLGGPQAGIIAGRRDLVRQIASNPLARAMRVDKLTLAALEAVLELYREPDRLARTLPTIRMLSLGERELLDRAHKLLDTMEQVIPNHGDLSIVDAFGEVGGGTLPGTSLPGKAVAFRPHHVSAHGLQQELRLVQAKNHIQQRELFPVIVPIQDDRLTFHVRTLLPGQVDAIASALDMVLGGEVR